MVPEINILYVQPYVTFAGVISDTLPGHLARNGYKIGIVSYSRNRNLAEMPSKPRNMRFYSVDALSLSIPNLVTEFPYFLHLEKVIKLIQPDLIHINNLPFITTVQSARLAKKNHVKSVIQIHGIFGDRGVLLNLLQKAFIRIFGRSIFKNVDALICLTAEDAQKLVASGCPNEKICIIANGVDVKKFHLFCCAGTDGAEGCRMRSCRYYRF